MKERPILFSGPMVRAILEGRKTQTRRVIKPQPESMKELPPSCPHGYIGDQLWVRETFSDVNNCGAPALMYRADHELRDLMEEREFLEEDGSMNYEHPQIAKYDWAVWFDDVDTEKAWRPSIFMPRWVSRLQLEITELRIERLQDISAKDALAEGADSTNVGCSVPEEAFWELWDSINGASHPWDSNPWVWVIGFRRI